MIAPFEMPFDQDMLDDLRRRLASARWTDAVAADWSQGTERGFLRHLIAFWRDRYDWRERREALNRVPHRRASSTGSASTSSISRAGAAGPCRCS